MFVTRSKWDSANVLIYNQTLNKFENELKYIQFTHGSIDKAWIIDNKYLFLDLLLVGKQLALKSSQMKLHFKKKKLYKKKLTQMIFSGSNYFPTSSTFISTNVIHF